MITSLASLMAVIVFYFNIFFIFGFDEYFQQTSVELSVVSFISIIIFINTSNSYQNKRIQQIEIQKQNYFKEMNRYIELSNQLSRYAPLQLWQSIMRGDSVAKLEYKRKNISLFLRYSRFYRIIGKAYS